MGSSGKRTRGPNKQTPWSRNPDDGVSVFRLALDTSDPLQRARIESMFQGAYQVTRALQRGVRNACRAYWAAPHERASDPAAVRTRLGLSRPGLERRAYAYLDEAPHLRRFVTKALAMHLADAVWTTAERHLFADASGERHGRPKVGRWFDFTRLPGRARSHTTERKWETFRLHGSLAGHRAAYTDCSGDFVQPTPLRQVPATNDWWSYDGPLAVVFTGLATGTLVLPVRLPTAPSNQPAVDHHLADPSRWHKITLVRDPDPHTEGGWRYTAHLMVLTQPYVSPAAAARRARAAIETLDRTAGIDVNVSNITVASHDTGGAMKLTRIERTAGQKEREWKRKKRERIRARQLERSRRATNRAQYHLSKRQEKHARRLAAAGRAVDMIPMGPRKARTDGVPLQRFGHDELSKTFRHKRAVHAAQAAAASRARRDHARSLAAAIVATHGYQLVVEDTSIAAWASSWGRALAAFSPATLVAAIDRAARAVGALAGGAGGVVRASTRTTALSQHCPCGARVGKSLRVRMHHCPDCGLRGDRDAVAAVLASFVALVRRDDPTSARVDYQASIEALPHIRRLLEPFSYDGWQDTLTESTGLSARDGSFVAWPTPTPQSQIRVAVARRNVGTAPCSTRNEPGYRQTKSERARVRTDMSPQCGPSWTHLRDNS